jgi:NADH dehydrogenase FAD-containing subunit
MAGGFPDEFRVLLRKQLDEHGIVFADEPVDADLRFDCFGAAPVTGFADLPARRPDGRIAVEADLRVCGTERVFAIGDITALPELKMARLAQMHAGVVAANIRAMIEGRSGPATYQPQPDAIVLPLGPRGGVSYAPEAGVLGAAETAAIKAGFYLDQYRELLGVR